MKIISCIQGSPEWLALRAGIPTASEFDKILTPGGKASASAEKYLFGLLAERMMGHPRIEAVSTWMQRGNEMEAEAVAFYEAQRDLETVPVGFVTNDAETVGASPDRLVGEDGLLEIKVPSDPVHVSYLLKKAVDQAYYPQVQGQLWITERKWADILSYHPEMPPALIRVERDEEFIKLLSEAVEEFSRLLEEAAADLTARGWILPAEKPAETFITDSDLSWVAGTTASPDTGTEPAGAEGLVTSTSAPKGVGGIPPVLPPTEEAGATAQPPSSAAPAPTVKPRGRPKTITNEILAGEMGLFLEKGAATWKKRLHDPASEVPNAAYYAVLGNLGVEHANKLSEPSKRLMALVAWSEAYKRGKVPSATQNAATAPAGRQDGHSGEQPEVPITWESMKSVAVMICDIVGCTQETLLRYVKGAVHGNPNGTLEMGDGKFVKSILEILSRLPGADMRSKLSPYGTVAEPGPKIGQGMGQLRL